MEGSDGISTLSILVRTNKEVTCLGLSRPLSLLRICKEGKQAGRQRMMLILCLT
jgi:hypothetical protein